MYIILAHVAGCFVADKIIQKIRVEFVDGATTACIPFWKVEKTHDVKLRDGHPSSYIVLAQKSKFVKNRGQLRFDELNPLLHLHANGEFGLVTKSAYEGPENLRDKGLKRVVGADGGTPTMGCSTCTIPLFSSTSDNFHYVCKDQPLPIFFLFLARAMHDVKR